MKEKLPPELPPELPPDGQGRGRTNWDGARPEGQKMPKKSDWPAQLGKDRDGSMRLTKPLLYP
jgi:hypothetical protein